MNAKRLAAIKTRCEAATPGPWKLSAQHPQSVEIGLSHNETVIAYGGTNGNAKFISHAREDVPALLADLEAAEAKLTEVTPQAGGGPVPQNRLDRLDYLASLKDGWYDGTGLAMKPESIAMARILLSVVGGNPGVFPNPDGYIQFEWLEPDFHIEIQLDPDNDNSGVACYTPEDPEGTAHA